jgi:hypothetical protein
MDSIYNKNGSLHVVTQIKRFCVCVVEPASLSPSHGEAAGTATCFQNVLMKYCSCLDVLPLVFKNRASYI